MKELKQQLDEFIMLINCADTLKEHKNHLSHEFPAENEKSVEQATKMILVQAEQTLLQMLDYLQNITKEFKNYNNTENNHIELSDNKIVAEQTQSETANKQTAIDVTEPDIVQKPTETISKIEEIKNILPENNNTEQQKNNANTEILGNKSTEKQPALVLGIADRFRYQRELFDGNGEKLSNAIADFNKMESFEQAQNYIAEKLKWDADNAVVKDFIELLKKNKK